MGKIVEITTDVYDQDPEIKALVAAMPPALPMVILNQVAADQASQELTVIKSQLSWLEDKRKKVMAPLKAAVEQLNELFAGPKKQLQAREVALKQGLQAYLAKVEAERKAEQARLEEIARAERQRIEEKARKEAEKAALAAAEARRKAEEAESQGKAAAAAKAAQKAAEIEAAAKAKAAVSQLQIQAVKEPVQAAKTVVSGVHTRKVWKYKLANLDKVPRDYLELSHDAVKTAMSAGVLEIPGIEIYQEEELVRSK